MMAFVLLATTGCVSTAGPFITNVLPAGDGRVSIEKCKVNYNKFSNTISMGQCDTITVELVSVAQRQPREERRDEDEDQDAQPKKKKKKKD